MIADAFGYFMLFIIFILILHVVYMVCGLWDNYPITIRLPKRKRFTIKVSPIYKLKKQEYDSDYVLIEKWELGWVDKVYLLCVLFPYPLMFKIWKYNHVGNVCVGKDNSCIMEITEDLETIFERKWIINNAEWEESRRKDKEKEDKFNSLNKVFNENYEK